MEIAGYSYTFGPITGPRAIDHLKVIRWFHDLGIRSLEMFDPWIRDKPDEVKVIRDVVGELNMPVRVCDVECHVVSRNADERKAGLERFHQRLAAVNEFGTEMVLILPYLPPWESDYTADECHEYLNAAIDQSLPLARQMGMTLLIANLGFRGDIYGQADWVVETCKAFAPDIKTVYDVGNFVMAGEDPVKALDKVFDYTVHVHLKDWVILPEEQPGASWLGVGRQWFQGSNYGDGVVPLTDAIARLKELNYDALVSPEYEGPEDPFDIMGKGIAYTRKMLA